jgi:hypothetical protein
MVKETYDNDIHANTNIQFVGIEKKRIEMQSYYMFPFFGSGFLAFSFIVFVCDSFKERTIPLSHTNEMQVHESRVSLDGTLMGLFSANYGLRLPFGT